MPEYNNIYNFKNPVRHFLNIDNLIFRNPESIDINDTSWTVPVKFRVLKNESDFRTLKLPNILQFAVAYEHFKDFPEFCDSYGMEEKHKRLSAKLNTGDFTIGSFEDQLQTDFNNLCIYDNLMKLDIKDFYGRIYTHYLDFNGLEDRYLTNMNNGATNGIIMGNYLSLYFAEQHLAKISQKIENELATENINCEYSYFSDDFYFFCNKHDNNRIKKIFDKVLEEFDLERNSHKNMIYDYPSYTEETIMTRYWKKINAYANTHSRNRKRDIKKHLVFINQLLYRISDFSIKNKRIFINNFFKGKYFYSIKEKLTEYELTDYEYHELCYLYRTSPEALLYSIELIKQLPDFDSEKIKKFFEVRFKESLKNQHHDIQLYYYYAIIILNLNDILDDTSDLVLKTENQLLISYYIQSDMFSEDQYSQLKTFTDEKYWFQNYHLVLNNEELYMDLENSINTYLIPKKCILKNTEKQVIRKQNYYNFYLDNLQARKSIVVNPQDISSAIDVYLNRRFEEENELMEKHGFNITTTDSEEIKKLFEPLTPLKNFDMPLDL